MWRHCVSGVTSEPINLCVCVCEIYTRCMEIMHGYIAEVCSRLMAEGVCFRTKNWLFVVCMWIVHLLFFFYVVVDVVLSISVPGVQGGCSTVVFTLVRRQAAPSSTWRTTWCSTRSLLWSTTTSRWRCAATSLRWSWLSRCLRPMLTRAKSESRAALKEFFYYETLMTFSDVHLVVFFLVEGQHRVQ